MDPFSYNVTSRSMMVTPPLRGSKFMDPVPLGTSGGLPHRM